MIRGINGKPYIALDNYLDIDGFKNLHPEICKGFALAREYAKEGTWMEPGFKFDDMSYVLNWKPIYQAFAAPCAADCVSTAILNVSPDAGFAGALNLQVKPTSS